MLQWAKEERGIERIATGHYARVRHGDQSENGRHQLLRASMNGKIRIFPL